MKTMISVFLCFIISAVMCLFILKPTREMSPISDIASSTQNKKTTISEISGALNHSGVRAIWLSQFDMYEIYTEGSEQRDIYEYTALTKKVISNISKIGVNTVFIQLRPNGDSIYPSEIYPTSKYAVGSYGKEHHYDPFPIFLELAHDQNISVHAWINPLRCMAVEYIGNIPDKYPIKRWYSDSAKSYVKEVGDYLYLDPAYNDVRDLICDGVSEILEKYDVDGIHIDDYFYPTIEESFDRESYLTNNAENLSLGDFRREQINKLVSAIYDTVKAKSSSLLFGVSPSGNNTRNYNELFADVSKWCSEAGYIDYLCPQIYFGFDHSTHPFDEVAKEFIDMTEKSSVNLIIGITLEKAHNGFYDRGDTWAGAGYNEWIEQKNIIKRSLEYVRALDDKCGIAIFSYRLIFDPITGEALDSTREECENFLPVFKEM